MVVLVFLLFLCGVFVAENKFLTKRCEEYFGAMCIVVVACMYVTMLSWRKRLAVQHVQ